MKKSSITSKLYNLDSELNFTHEEIIALLEIWCTPETQQKFHSTNDKDSVWNEISKKMAEHGFYHSAKNCKEYFELLTEEFYYICSDLCCLPDDIKESWVYRGYLEPWLVIPTVQHAVLLKRDITDKHAFGTEHLPKFSVMGEETPECRNIIPIDMLENIRRKSSLIKIRVKRHVRFRDTSELTPARKDEVFHLPVEDLRRNNDNENKRCCHIS